MKWTDANIIINEIIEQNIDFSDLTIQDKYYIEKLTDTVYESIMKKLVTSHNRSKTNDN